MQVFKWERRKGWDVLLKAFLTEFTSKNNVALYLKTSPFHGGSNFAEQMQQWVEDHMLESEASLDKLPAVYVIDEHMTQDRLRSLYAAVDCFVLPSRCDCSRSTSLDSVGCGCTKHSTHSRRGPGPTQDICVKFLFMEVPCRPMQFQHLWMA